MDRAGSRPQTAGFTLVELLVVTVVLAIVTGIAIVALVGALDKARQGATIADMRNLGTAIQAYQVDNGRPPPAGSGFAEVAAVLASYQNSTVPTVDHWGNLYGYETDAGGRYSLISFGKDGIDGPDLTESTKGEFHRDIIFSGGEFAGLAE